MKKNFVALFFFVLLIPMLSGCDFKRSAGDNIHNTMAPSSGGEIVLTPSRYNAVAKMPGTATFSEYGVIVGALEESGVLENIEGYTYEAGVVFRADFEDGYISRYGQIWNVTESDQDIEVAFFRDDSLIASYNVHMNPLTTYHLVPEGQLSNVTGANKVVISGLNYTSVVQNSSGSESESGSTHPSDGYETPAAEYVTASFYGEYPEDPDCYVRIHLYDNGTCHVTEETMEESYDCDGRYIMDGNCAKITWDSGEMETIRVDGEPFNRYGVLMSLL